MMQQSCTNLLPACHQIKKRQIDDHKHSLLIEARNTQLLSYLQHAAGPYDVCRDETETYVFFSVPSPGLVLFYFPVHII